MRDRMLNGGAYSRTAFLAINKTATAGSTGDNTEVDSAWVDRVAEGKGMALSAKLVITFTAALGDGATLAFSGNLRDASSIAGAGAADFGEAFSGKVAATGDSGGSTETDTFEIDVDLSGARGFIQAQITPDLSRANTDTCEWSAALVLYGDHRQPSTKAAALIGTANAI